MLQKSHIDDKLQVSTSLLLTVTVYMHVNNFLETTYRSQFS